MKNKVGKPIHSQFTCGYVIVNSVIGIEPCRLLHSQVVYYKCRLFIKNFIEFNT